MKVIEKRTVSLDEYDIRDAVVYWLDNVHEIGVRAVDIQWEVGEREMTVTEEADPREPL